MAHSTDSSSSSSKSHDGTRMYNPYEQLNGPAQYLYSLPTSPEFLFDEEAMRKGRTWSENLCSCSGAGYVLGGISGALKGSVDGLKSSEAGETIKLRTARVLNRGGHTARKFGNSVALIGMFYAGFESMLKGCRDTDDEWNTVGAGFGTGALYRAAGGPRSAVIGGALGAFAAGLYVVGKQMLKKYVPLE
ncbi:mitochondrial import inner membrane translocase subunit TIM23-2-like [Papaver somniferum]|uniref:mitochondrial import inner membrane translocase subunit TIM23-2-like n=1 Tax=Papaver somniferum TaxID=3469 RepID=UPI000E6F4A05|nr:mitochondrial import inner membrane translocase subunit TIM23-2-like [Papaver somniferum]